MEIRDPVHGAIHILDEEIPIIRHQFFERLRGIKQLGFSEYVFPGATHTRFIHSIGVLNIGEKAFQTLFRARILDSSESDKLDYKRLEETFKLACLLHDIGHAPLSHSTESVMPMLSDLKVDSRYLSETDKKVDRQATHEDYTIKAITGSSFSESFESVHEAFGVLKSRVADIIVGRTQAPEYFTVGGLNIFPLLHQLVSGELDCDRMDYLLRDSYFCGVSYGGYDLDWLLDNLEVCEIDGKGYLGITERAVVTFDDFLLSRYHMFLMVYFHYRSVCLEQLLLKYFRETQKGQVHEYQIPADIEAYCEHDDHYLMKILRKSKNKHAIAIVKNQIPPKIFESFNEEQLKKLEKIEIFFDENNIDYIRGSSAGRLSKYYTQDKKNTEFEIKVMRKLVGTFERFYTNIHEATDLFSKFSKSHAVNRLHCQIDLLPKNLQMHILQLIKQ